MLNFPVYSFYDDATTAKGPACDDGTNSSYHDFAVVPVNTTHDRVPFNAFTNRADQDQAGLVRAA